MTEGTVQDAQVRGQTREQLEDLEARLIRWGEHMDNVRAATQRASQAFGTLVESWLSGTRDLRDSLAQLAAQLAQLAIQNLVLAPLFRSIFTAVPFLATVFAGGETSTPVNIVGGLGSGPPGFQRGGFHRGGLAIVGERGPELADFRRPTRIYPTEDLAAAVSGAGGVTINFAPVISSVDEAGV